MKLTTFRLWWFLTLALGAIFLIGTAREWHHLIYDKGLTISTNLFGTTYYSLVGLHAFHVSIGLVGLAIVLILALLNLIRQEHVRNVDTFAMYWHFVDAVWVVVFTVVYIVGR
jgi:cytochrome c oxidase subunit 3/cytochrome o ubiquinol oxidase subunit 3